MKPSLQSRLLLVALCALLFMGGAHPILSASAHLGPEGSATSALFTLNNGFDNCRAEGFKEVCTGHDGVSGSYVNYHENMYLVDGVLLFPDNFAIGSATTWCDMEVQGSGSSGDQLLDEERVNDEPTPGLLADGTWDDGGIGGACHTFFHYEEPGYDYPGCGRDGSVAHAKDAVSAGDVWIGAACDSITTPEPVSFELCVFNELLSNPNAPGIVECLGDYVAPFESCGADGLTDETYYGHGNSGVPYPPAAYHLGCNDGHSAPAVFTYSYVNLANNHLIPATRGWIDSRDY